MVSPQWLAKTPKGTHFPNSFGYLPRIVKHLLLLRNDWTEESLTDFLNPKLKNLSDPFLIGEMHETVERIFKAIDNGEVITLFGDYDVDGITSLTLMSRMLSAYGVTARLVIPVRGAEGYGLTQLAVERCFSENPDTQLLIAMDCGTSSVEEIANISHKGVDVIVLDHHEPNTPVRPACYSIVNPKACFTPNASGDFSYLCAAGVVFKVCHALLKTRRLPDVELKDLLDLVAIATVADIVPLVEENRILVKHGLKVLGTTDKLGLIALKEVAGVGDNPESGDIGYRIGPRINAAGRMDAPIEALEMLLTTCPTSADYLVARLNRYNMERQSYEKAIQKEATDMVINNGLEKHHCLIIGKRGWHPGVVGIVAARLMRRFFKPTFVIAFNENGEGKGSGRSINGLSLVDAIEAGREYLLAGGGHHAAAGISLKEEELENFQDALNKYFSEHTTQEQRNPKLEIDAEVGFDELSFQFLESYEKLKPFGPENPQPVFMTRMVTHSRPPRELKNKHMKLYLAQAGVQQEAMFFGGAALDLPPQPWDICYTVDKNVFRGRVSLQLTIQHVRSSI